MERDDLRALQDVWNRKLKDSGFDDIEESRGRYVSLKSGHSLYFHCRYTPEAFEQKSEYYRRASQFLYEFPFQWTPGSTLINLKEREVWRLHAEGKSLRELADLLKLRGFEINKDSANKIVQKLATLMWSYENTR